LGFVLRFAGQTDVGSVREHNEDAWRHTVDGSMVVVADGMGGHQAGEVAADMATQELADLFEEREAPKPWWRFWSAPPSGQARLVDAVQRANRTVFTTSLRDPSRQGMGTTLVAIWLDGDVVHHAHVGDSRLYRLRGDSFEQLTEDHSLLNKYRQAGLVSDADAARFPYKNVIVRALGLWPKTRIDADTATIEAGDRLLLCSDGLTDLVDDTTIYRQLRAAKAPADAAAELVQAALQAGGIDNITAVVVDVEFEDS
jgi:serine/threonine protein phosphatase PrpC